MLLKMGKLGETLWTNFTAERPFSRMCPYMHLKIGKLTELFVTRFTAILKFAILLLKRIWQRFVATVVPYSQLLHLIWLQLYLMLFKHLGNS